MLHTSEACLSGYAGCDFSSFQDFNDLNMFQITSEEAESLRRSRSQFATLKRGQHTKYLPYAFTEHGTIMAATVLNSPEAIRMSVFVVRAFVKMRETLISRAELEKRLLRIENVLLAHDESIRELYKHIRPLLHRHPTPQEGRFTPLNSSWQLEE